MIQGKDQSDWQSIKALASNTCSQFKQLLRYRQNEIVGNVLEHGQYDDYGTQRLFGDNFCCESDVASYLLPLSKDIIDNAIYQYNLKNIAVETENALLLAEKERRQSSRYPSFFPVPYERISSLPSCQTLSIDSVSYGDIQREINRLKAIKIIQATNALNEFGSRKRLQAIRQLSSCLFSPKIESILLIRFEIDELSAKRSLAVEGHDEKLASMIRGEINDVLNDLDNVLRSAGVKEDSLPEARRMILSSAEIFATSSQKSTSLEGGYSVLFCHLQ